MKKFFLSLVGALAISSSMYANESPLWLRHQSISPDGSQIAFCYGGDIYTVPVHGGVAKRITANPAYDGNPKWSPDGKQIAFESNREGSFDIYVVGSEGGNPLRLTYNSGSEHINTFLNDSTILYNSFVMPDHVFSMFPSNLFPQVYSVSVRGGRSHRLSSYPMEMISVRPDGAFIYTDVKGYEDPFRKHEKASVCRDIWMRSEDGKSFKQLTHFKGEDRNAVWDISGKGFYYLSEKDGNSNVYYRPDASNEKEELQITHFTKNPVRFLSIAKDGTLSFGYDGEMYILPTNAKDPCKVDVKIYADTETESIKYQTLTSGCQSFSLSPNQKEVAFVVHGDVFVANVEYGTTKRITNTPEQERDVQFSPDGRMLMYSSERDGCWNIYATKLTDKSDKLFCYAQNIKEEPLTTSKDLPCFQSLFSPDGKKIAYLRNRTEIVGKDLVSGKEWVIMPGKYQYSYVDGDQNFRWSPDGKWILTDFIGIGGWNNKDIAIFAADGSGKFTNLTESGYSEGGGKWVFGGKAILFSSDRAGMRSHGSWGAEDDYYLMFLDADAYMKFKRSKEERELYASADSVSSTDSKAKKTKKDKSKVEDSVKPVKFDLSNRADRTVRLTMASGGLYDAVLNKEGTKLYYLAAYGTNIGLWELDLDDGSTKMLVNGIQGGNLELSKDGTSIFCGNSQRIQKISLDGSAKPVEFRANFELQPYAQREYIFEHAWKQVKDKFYDPKLHGVDWDYYRKAYKKFLPYINNDVDFAELLSEMLGELNASHTGARYFPENNAPATAALGAFFDESYKGDGLKIIEVLSGSPLDRADSLFTSGSVITSIDGKPIKANEPIELLLNGKVGKRVQLQVMNGKKSSDVIVKPISQSDQSELLYRRWLKRREDLVQKWGGNQVAYVYVRAMDSKSFREVFKNLLGKYRNALTAVIDTRYNGGGWLHDDLVILLGGQLSIRYTPRGQYIGPDPFMQWCRPSCVLQSEGNYSNGHGFPWFYKTLKMGKLIGTPVPGTMTAVWWETQINPRIVFGIPQVTSLDMQGQALENQELEPDILIYNTPEDYIAGRDVQLKRAVDEMIKETSSPRAQDFNIK
ncbi:S41 family peptidase [Falsiporphyromonas endometrii]|uniref:Tricorn protease homolog n=1 Tax=Falsiporphyromonas endometrii TaxID=1387297 RepID=A0ABV9K4J0_9PORP